MNASTRSPLWFALVVAVTVLVLHRAAGSEPAARRPNVIFLLSDNQPSDTIHALGNPYIETPNLDRLVAMGSTFTRAIAANPHCVPSRAEILSGATGFTNLSSPFGNSLNPQLVLWPAAMRAAGYHTWYCGKWHTAGTAWERGYEETRALLGGHLRDRPQTHPKMRNGRPATGYKGTVFVNDKNEPEPEKGVGLTPHTDRHIADGAIEFIRRKSERPFFLHVNFTATHDPLLPAPGYENKYQPAGIPLPPNFMPEPLFDYGNARGRDELLLPSPFTPADIRQELADLYAVVSNLDAQVGRILAALEETGQAGNTILIFTTDHGAGVGRHGIRGYQNMYEHTLNIPVILSGPGIPRNQRIGAQAYLRDLYPTVCDLTGIPIPPTVEAKSLAPVLRGTAREIHSEVYAYWHGEGRSGEARQYDAELPLERMVRTDRWKLIYYAHLDRYQLFDLAADPYELRDRASDPTQATTLAEMKRKLEAWFTPRIDRYYGETKRERPGKKESARESRE
jgi:arylsulfatase A-like enzyme